MVVPYRDINTRLRLLTRENRGNSREEKRARKRREVASRCEADFVLHARIAGAQILGNFSPAVLNHRARRRGYAVGVSWSRRRWCRRMWMMTATMMTKTEAPKPSSLVGRSSRHLPCLSHYLKAGSTNRVRGMQPCRLHQTNRRITHLGGYARRVS